MSKTESRQGRKEATRRAIADAALSLSEAGGLSALSLRQVAKEVGIVPTAFYRHFASIDELGVALVEESFTGFRTLLEQVARSGDIEEMLRGAVDGVAHQVSGRSAQLTFIARERLAGPPAVRARIRQEIQQLQRDLTTGLARVPGTEALSAADLALLADTIIELLVSIAEALLIEPGRSSQIAADGLRKLWMLIVGVAHWDSSR